MLLRAQRLFAVEALVSEPDLRESLEETVTATAMTALSRAKSDLLHFAVLTWLWSLCVA
jgi:hypothetical protein